MPLTRNDSEERGSIATRMSLRNVDDFTVYATKPTTFTAGPRMLLPVQGHQVYENPTYVFNTGKVPGTTSVGNLVVAAADGHCTPEVVRDYFVEQLDLSDIISPN